MKKLELKDIKIIGEGQQIRRAIEEKYGSAEEFYSKYCPSLSLSAFKTYLSREIIRSNTFKCIATNALDVGFKSTLVSPVEQVKDFTYRIYNNIKLYNEDADYATIEAVLNLCKSKRLTLETAMMYRAMGRNCYFRNKFNRAVEFYEYAIDAVPKKEVSKLTFFHCELADMYFREDMSKKAEGQFIVAEGYIKKHELDNEALFYYYYWKGIMYVNTEKYHLAKEYFEKAGNYATHNFEKAAFIFNIGLTLKKEANYEEALKYYDNALIYYEDSDIVGRCSVYNNIAEVYRLLGDYDNATNYISCALELTENSNMIDRFLLYTETYAEIQLLRGNYSACKKYFDILRSTKRKPIHKIRVLNGINNIIEVLDNVNTLKQFGEVIIELLNEENNKEYLDDLYACLGKIYVKIHNRIFSGGI